MNAIPVVLFAYARPAHLRRVLACLRANGVPLILAYADGAKGAADAGAVGEVRRLLRAVDWCDLRLTERAENRGLGRNVLAGVTEVAARHGSFIVWEDDLIAVPGTYAWLAAALRHYEDEPRVMSVTAWTHPRVRPADAGAVPYFDRRAECWVWGAYARSWQGMEASAREKAAAAAARGLAADAYGSDLPAMAALEARNNIWAVRWLYHHLAGDGLCLRPPWSMVEHVGFDASATNAGAAHGWVNPPLRPAPAPGGWPEPREHPDCRARWREATRLARESLLARAKRAARRLLPRGLVAPVQRRFLRVRWTGDYPDWPAAEKRSGGYDRAEILERVLAAARLVRDGRKGYERDGVAFDGAPPWWPGQEVLAAPGREGAGPLTVLDFGGSLGSLYFQVRHLLAVPGGLSWRVVEQPAFVEAGRRELASDSLSFHATVDEALAGGVPDVLVLGSVLPYLFRPLEILRELLGRRPAHVLVERTGFTTTGRARLTVQRVPRSIYPASYPCWFLDRAEFLAAFAGSYRLTCEQRDDIETPAGLEFRSFQFDRIPG